ncbi:CinA family protein [Demequina sp. NBRC 110057]|uniref:CinA family protein n=1 Tax=Demequina sp. NBRC 110057 TaxID=1570346 RepID=UPI0009FC38A4|nr:CinA family protein [Demequina sp. NBRC 110057]
MPGTNPALVVSAAVGRGATLACGESLTGGALCAALVDVPGASAVVRGGVVAYQVDVKHDLLGVPQGPLDDPGPVSETVALAMARGVRERLGASLGIATTGVAGPEAHGGKEPGTVCVAVVWPGGEATRTVRLAGDRAQVRAGAVDAALAMALQVLEDPSHQGSW